jgi:DNA polymerase-1
MSKTQQDIRKVDIQLLKDYAAEDADVTFRLKQIFEQELKENKEQGAKNKDNSIFNLFEEIEMPLVAVLARMERNGVRIDVDALRQSSEILTVEMQNLELKII